MIAQGNMKALLFYSHNYVLYLINNLNTSSMIRYYHQHYIDDFQKNYASIAAFFYFILSDTVVDYVEMHIHKAS